MPLETRLKWFVSAGLILNMVGFLAPATVLPQILDDWQLGERAGGILTGSLFGGYALSSPVLSALTDRIDAKRVMLAALLASSAAGYGIAYVADGLESAVAFRVLAGFGMAGFYMPGLKLIADLLEGDARMRAAAIYPSMFAVGSAGPFFIAALLDPTDDWRWIFIVSGHAGLAAFVMIALCVPPAPVRKGIQAIRFTGAVVQAIRNPGVQAYSLAAVGHISEIFSFRSWIIAAMVFGVSLPINTGFADWNLPLLAALSSVFTVPASILTARFSISHDRRKVLFVVSVLSACVALGMAFAVHGPFWIFYLVLLLYSLTTFADTASISSGVVVHADAESRGMALAVFSTASFGGGMAGPVIIGSLIEMSGGRQAAEAWTAAHIGLACFALIPALAMVLFARRIGRR